MNTIYIYIYIYIIHCLLYCQVWCLQKQCIFIWPLVFYLSTLFLINFYPFFLFLSLFSMLFFFYIMQFLGGLHFFWEDYSFVFKESNTLPYLKKIEDKIIVFNKKAVMKISRISNSTRPPRNHVKFFAELKYSYQWKYSA